MRKQKIIVTGTEKDAPVFSTLLNELGFNSVPLPTIRITKKNLDDASVIALKAVETYDYLIFTSAYAVQFLAEALRDLWIKIPQHSKVIAVGPATARACRTVGLNPYLVPKKFNASEIITAITAMAPIANKKILFPRSAIAPPQTIQALEAAGAMVSAISLYETHLVTAPGDAFQKGIDDADCIVFMSPSGITGFAKNFQENIIAEHVLEMRAICIGPTTAAAAKAVGFKHLLIAKPSTTEGIIKALRNDQNSYAA